MRLGDLIPLPGLWSITTMPEALPKTQFFRCPRVELFRLGDWQGDVYTSQDLDDLVYNFNLRAPHGGPLHEPAVFFDPALPENLKTLRPASLGHEDDQPILDGLVEAGRTDIPASGWVTELVRDGDSVYGDLGRIPADVAQWIKDGRYKHVSVELYDDANQPEGVPMRGRCMLRRLSLLGAEPPHIKQLANLTDPIPDGRFAETPRPVRSYAFPLTNPLRCFAENTMNPENQAALAAAGFSPELIAKLTDEEAAMLLSKVAAPAPATTPAETALAEGDPVDRTALDQEAMSLGASAEMVAGMSVDELKVWIDQAKAAAAAPAATPMGEGGKGKMFSEAAVKKFAEEAVAKAMANQRKQNEAVNAQLLANARELRKQTIAARRKQFSEAVDAAVAKGVPPAVFDDNILLDLALDLEAGKVKKFGEKSLTPFDAMLSWIGSLPTSAMGQTLGASGKPKTSQDAEEAKVRRHFSENADSFKKLGHTEEMRLKAFRLEQQRRGMTADQFINS